MSRPESESPNFEDALGELERILRDLEDGSTSLEESLSRYERGVGLLKHCYARLNEAEQRIVQLTGNDDDEPVTKPFAIPESNGKARPRAGDDGGSDGTLPF